MTTKLSLAVVAALLLASTASAEVLTVDCRVHGTEPGNNRNGIRRLRIDLSAKTVKVWDNTGKGFVVRGEHSIVSADASRIVLDSGGTKTSSVDRHTGQYVFRDTAKKLTIQGRCAKASAGAATF